jgi:tRNA A-37 threonylcarbamoyl transferase component Bud32
MYIKENVSLQEYKMHKYVYDLHIIRVPKICKYCKKDKILTLEMINGMNVSDFYGDCIENIPIFIIEQIRDIIKILVANNIEYRDITGYNFVLDEETEMVWLVDFEHCTKKKTTDSYILNFCDGDYKWNPEFY